jgi:hypothetical protein
VLVPPPRENAGPRIWREEGRSPALDLAPLAVAGLRALAQPGTSVAEPPRVAWDALSKTVPGGRLDGVWTRGPDGPVALFDLGRSYRWLLGERIRRMWLDADLAVLVQAQVLESLPELAGIARPAARKDDWVFRPDWPALPEVRGDEPEFALTLLDLEGFACLEIAGLRRAEELVFPDVEDFAAGRWREGGALSWSVELRAGGQVLARTSGR